MSNYRNILPQEKPSTTVSKIQLLYHLLEYQQAYKRIFCLYFPKFLAPNFIQEVNLNSADPYTHASWTSDHLVHLAAFVLPNLLNVAVAHYISTLLFTAQTPEERRVQKNLRSLEQITSTLPIWGPLQNSTNSNRQHLCSQQQPSAHLDPLDARSPTASGWKDHTEHTGDISAW